MHAALLQNDELLTVAPEGADRDASRPFPLALRPRQRMLNSVGAADMRSTGVCADDR